jgi:hypothetical protein
LDEIGAGGGSQGICPRSFEGNRRPFRIVLVIPVGIGGCRHDAVELDRHGLETGQCRGSLGLEPGPGDVVVDGTSL